MNAPTTLSKPTWIKAIRPILLGLLTIIALSLILTLDIFPNKRVQLELGDVSPTDLRAPNQITYESKLYTESERARAASAVERVYSPADFSIARQQVSRARLISDYIGSVRNDPYATIQEKKEWISQIPDLTLSPTVIERILSLPEESWQQVATEIERVLNRVMREEIRDNQLVAKKRSVGSIIDITLSDAQISVIRSIVKELIVPNSLFDQSATEEHIAQAKEQVSPVTVKLEKGQIILREGDIVSADKLEALDALGLRQVKTDWYKIASVVLFITILIFALWFYIALEQPDCWNKNHHLLLVSLLMIISTFTAKLMVPEHNILPYLFPFAAVAMILAVLFNPHLAIATSTILSLIVGFIAPSGQTLQMIILESVAGIVASLGLGRGEKLSNFLRAGLHISLLNILVNLVFRVPTQDYDLMDIAVYTTAGFLNGGLTTSIALASFSLLGTIFGIITAPQLQELARPTHPLFRQLLLKAPGTYHHSILLSNLVEQAAETVGADPLLARVGAYYHDIGKIMRPYFFVENQADGVNVHDRLDPQTSAQIIISHVTDGVELARKYHLPPAIQDFISQHHGDSLASFFYHKAKEGIEEQEIDRSLFQYPGSKPQSKETAILMLADGCEAMVRSAKPSSAEEIEALIDKNFRDRIASGMLDECPLTMKDIAKTKVIFASVLQGIFHPRIKYPEQKEKKGEQFE